MNLEEIKKEMHRRRQLWFMWHEAKDKKQKKHILAVIGGLRL